MKKKQPGYEEAFDELQRIVSEMEEGDIPVDELSAKVERAAELIRICKKKLVHTEAEVEKILKDLEKTDNDIPERH